MVAETKNKSAAALSIAAKILIEDLDRVRAAEEILESAARRTLPKDKGTLPLNGLERLVLQRVYPDDCRRGELQLRCKVEQARSVLERRERGVTRASIESAEKRYSEAKRIEIETEATLQDLDVVSSPSPALVRQAKGLEQKYKELQAATLQAESAAKRERADYDLLLARAPQVVRETVKASRACVSRGNDNHDKLALESIIREIEGFAKISKSSADLTKHESMIGYLKENAPELLEKINPSRPDIFRDAVRAYWLDREAELPNHRAELKKAQVRLDAAMAAAEEPLHTWAETGKIDADALINSLQ